MPDSLPQQTTPGGRDAAIKAVRDYAGGWEEGEPEALVDAIGAALLAECIEASESEVRRQTVAEIVTWLRECGYWPVTHIGHSAAIAIERQFGNADA